MRREKVNANMSHKKTIHFLVRELSLGGVAKSLVTIIKELANKNWVITISVSSLNWHYPLEQVLASPSVQVLFPLIPKTHFYSWLLKKSQSVWRTRTLTRPFWHLTNKIESLRQAILYSRLPKHDVVVGYHQGPLSKTAIRWAKAERKILWYHNDIMDDECREKDFLKAERIVVNTEYTKLILMEHWTHIPFDRFTVLPCLVDPDTIRSKARQFAPAFSSSTTNIVTVGRVSWEKGHDIALAAAGLLKRAGIEFQWFFIGGEPTDDLSSIVFREKLEKNVIFLPPLNNPYPYIANCDLFVLPSRRESYGIVLTEAMILGKPVVATKTFGAQSQIDDKMNGLLAETNPQSLYENIAWLASTPNARKSICTSLQLINWKERFVNRAKKLIQILE